MNILKKIEVASTLKTRSLGKVSRLEDDCLVIRGKPRKICSSYHSKELIFKWFIFRHDI